jgi:hypothetical protein
LTANGGEETPLPDALRTEVPAMRERVNAMNGMLCNNQGERAVVGEPGLNQLSWKAHSHDNLLPQIEPWIDARFRRVGISDGLEFGLRQTGGPWSTYVA